MHVTNPLHAGANCFGYAKRTYIYRRKERFPILNRIWCRSYQGVFKLAMPILPYRDPVILDSVLAVPGILKEKKIDRVLIVTDKSLHKLGLLESLKAALAESGVEYFIYDETVPNPTVSNVEAARTMYIENKCRALIGFGGGSSIDCAKAVGARIARPRTPIQRMKGILRIILPLPFLIAVPTTAGTGSETTVTTVITEEDTGYKYPISDFVLIPRVAVHDPEVTRSLPLSITSTTGMDALTHAIEAYIGNSTTPGTRADALEAARLIAENLETACRDGNNMAARAAMLRASYLAGRAFSKSYVGYCHAVAHTLGGKYNIPHGLANAVLIPIVLEAYGPSIYLKARDIAVAMHLADEDTPSSVATRRLIAKIREMNRSFGIPETLKGIREEDIPAMAKHAESEANPLYPVPVLMTARNLEQFYYAVMEV